MDSYPVTLTYNNFKEIVGNISVNPFKPIYYYTTVDDIDSHLFFNKEMSSHEKLEEIKFFIWNVIYAFGNDNEWHKENPNCSERNEENLIKYIFRPLQSKTGIPHTNIWTIGESEENIDNMEASFEYMQDILSDRNYLKIQEDDSIDDELYYEIMVRTKFTNYVRNIEIKNRTISVKLKAKYNVEPITGKTFKDIKNKMDVLTTKKEKS